MNACQKLSLLSLGLLAACSNSSSSYSIDRKTVNGLPTVTAVGNAEARVAVEAIDYANRTIALRAPDGVTHIFFASPGVRNFAQIKKGDTVHVDYSTRIVASVRKVSDSPMTSVTDAVQFAELGKKPGILCTRTAQIEATVQAINYASRQMELRTVSGAVFTLTADKKLKNLEAVHHGDQVVFDYTEAVSIRVD